MGGTDMVWTFDLVSLSVGYELLTKAGWDGETSVLAICFINFFWWCYQKGLMG